VRDIFRDAIQLGVFIESFPFLVFDIFFVFHGKCFDWRTPEHCRAKRQIGNQQDRKKEEQNHNADEFREMFSQHNEFLLTLKF